MHMRFYTFVAGILVASIVLSPMLFASTVHAQSSPPNSPVTLHVPFGLGLGASTAKDELLAGAFNRGGAQARQAMEQAIRNKEIIIDADLRGLKAEPYLERNGEKVASGKQAIAEYLAKLAEERKKQPESGKEASGDQCIPVAPGQFEDGKTISGDATFKPNNSPTGYGKTADPATMKIFEGPQDNGLIDVLPFPNVETPLNWKLRIMKRPALQEVVNDALEIKPQAVPGKPTPKTTVILPNAAQAQEFIASGGKSYTINGVKITPGGKYTVGKTGIDGVIFDENCDPKQGPVPSVGPNGDNPLGDFGEGNGDDFGGGGGGGGGDDGGGLGGLASLLPALMQLLGQQRQQNQPQQQQQQNPYTADCSQLGVSPVCGIDGKSYTNSCYAQQLGVPVAGTGPCVSPTPTPTLTPDVNAITAQLSQSGVPASLISTIRDAIVSALTTALGVSSRETVVQ